MNDRLAFLREKTSKLTTAPGVYRMRDKNNKIIYIGKAKNLRNRVTSYFREGMEHTPKVAKMVSLVFDYDFIVTDTEYEALVLECSLIKQNQPKYNIKLTDDKGYSWIKISDDEYPVITANLQKVGTGTFLGPFMSFFIARQAVNEANSVFMLPTCTRKFPQDFGKARPCLNFYINQCSGLCTGKIPKADFLRTVGEAVDYIKNGSENSIESLTLQMNRFAENLEFERAALCRNRINAIKKAAERQLIIAPEMRDTDIIAIAQSGDLTCAAVLIYRGGKLTDRCEYFLGETENRDETLEAFILQFYTETNDDETAKHAIPREILTEINLENAEILEELLRERSGHAVDLSNKKRGAGAKLIALAKTNAADSLAVRIGRTGSEVSALSELGELLGLKSPPIIIESFDISNLGSSSMVAGMVVFENGRPNKKYYKKFAIKDTLIQNDYASMAEVLRRRFNHYLDENETDEGFKRLPDLILLDGGAGQVNAVLPVLAELGIDVPLFGMVKDSKHRTRAIAVSDETGNGEIAIMGNKSAFRLVTQIQDEVHRFSISFQRKKHKTETLSTGLTNIKGIGQKKAAKLFTLVKTKEALTALTPTEIRTLLGVGETTADEVYKYIQSTDL